MSFDLHYGFETECDDTITEHERPKAPEPMILESLSNYDLSELLGKDEEPECIPIAPTETSNSKPQTISICAASSNTISKKNSSNMDYLVLEDIDDSDYIDNQIFTTGNSNMFIVQAMSQEPLLDNFTDSFENHHSGSAKAATTVSEKSIKSNKASSRLRRIASNITRAMSNKFRKLCHPTRVEGSSKVDHGENRDGVVCSSTSTQNLLQTSSSNQ